MFFVVIVTLSWIIQLVFSSYFATINRGDAHVVLRRLGIHEGKFWLYNYGFVLLPSLFSCILQSTIWHFSGVLPFAGLTYGFCLFEAVV